MATTTTKTLSAPPPSPPSPSSPPIVVVRPLGAGSVAIPLHLKLAVGGIAGVVGVTATFPIDIVKTHLQGQTRSAAGLFHGPISCFRHILATGGPAGLYRGLPATLVGVLPEKAIKLAVNEQLRELLSDNGSGTLSLGRQVLAGAGAGLAQVIATNPTEIVKIRLQTQSSLPVSERLTAWGVVQSLGPRGLYKGAGVCLLRDIPYAVIFFPLYATLRDAWSGGSSGRTSVPAILSAGAVAGATAAGLCTPADVIKTRMQLRGATYTGALDCLRQVVATSGYGALLKGAIPRMMVQAPLFGITLVAFELQKSYMEARHP